MNRENYDNLTKKSFGKVLFRIFCILLVLTSLTAWSVGGVFAKYVSSRDSGGFANVANMGIEKFELREHTAKEWSDVTADELKQMVAQNKLHILGTQEAATDQTISVPYGEVNVPKDPFIRLKINSTLNYELYLIVTESDNFPDTVSYSLTGDWERTTSTSYTGSGKLYKYKVTFTAGEQYDFTDSNVIKILQDDIVVVGQTDNAVTFSLTFEAYVKQVLE